MAADTPAAGKKGFLVRAWNFVRNNWIVLGLGVGGGMVLPVFLPNIIDAVSVASAAAGLPDPGLLDFAKAWYLGTMPGESYANLVPGWLNGWSTLGDMFGMAVDGNFGAGVDFNWDAAPA